MNNKLFAGLLFTVIFCTACQTTVFNPPLRIELPRATNFYIVSGDSTKGANIYADSICVVELSTYKDVRVKGVIQKMWLVEFHGENFGVLDKDVQKTFRKNEPAEKQEIKDVKINVAPTQCTAVTKSGKQCTRMTTNASGKCWQHGG